MSEQLNSEPVLARDDGFHPVTDQPAVVLAPDTCLLYTSPSPRD